MAITCQDVMKLRTFQHISLVAGESGLDRIVTWPYVGQTDRVSDWVHGGELLFITGIAHSEEVLPAVLEEAIQKDLSGLVVLVGSDYIKALPEGLIARANEARMPLFTMPWELKLIDVTHEITDLLLSEQWERKRVQQLLGNLLFAPVEEVEQVLQAATLENITIGPYNFIAIFALSQISFVEGRTTPEEKLQQFVMELCEHHKGNVFTMICGNQVVVLGSSFQKKEAWKQYAYVETLRDMLSQVTGDEHLLLAMGDVHEGVLGIRTSYKEALHTLTITRQLQHSLVGKYTELGIYRLLLQVQDNQELLYYYHHLLDPILEYDAKNDGDFLGTLRIYLETNCNISKTAQTLFLHRNSLLYRINKMKDLLQNDLENATIRMELLLAIIIKEYLAEDRALEE